MIFDLMEALDVLATAVAVWIVAFVAAVTGFGYGLAALGWCAWTAVRRGVTAAMAATAPRKALSGPLADEQPSSDSTVATPGERRSEPHTPAWARKEAA
ncbi:hypothetical protein [Streptomyces sp. NPDC060001]|uniref:hypothetical protein n=1 Tax=Streptomyces sp. NPDC060001 TaxID=3347032 RepID=UPI0036BBC915